jgi:YVTN family beta-propeller protein
VYVIDTSTNTVTATIVVGDSPVGVAITPDGSKAYVVNGSATSISVIDTSTNTVSDTITSATDNDCWGISLTPDGKYAYVPSLIHTVSVIDTSTNSLVTKIPGFGVIEGEHEPIAFGQFIQPPTQSTGSDMTSPQGRLTLSSSSPVMTADATAQSTIYYLPYVGAVVPVYNGSSFVNETLGSSGISLALDSNSAHTGYQASGSLFDIFAFMNSSVLTLGTGPAWTNSTTRSNALTQVSGIWVNNASITLRFGTASGNTVSASANQATYLGTMYATANGQTGMQFKPTGAAGGSGNVLGLYNACNRLSIRSIETDSTGSWTYATAAWRKVNNSASNSISFVDGLQQSSISTTYSVLGQINTSASLGVGVNLDSTTGTPDKYGVYTYATAACQVMVGAADLFSPQLGFHVLTAMENSFNGFTATFSGGSTMELVAELDM